ncbi:hypothetical protein D3C72_1729670 [compost metagenome]
MAQALDQPPHHHQRHGGVLCEATRELCAPEHEHIGLHLGTHRGRVGFVVDDAHLAEVVALREGGQNHLTPPAIRCHHAGAPREQDEQGVGFLPLLHQRLATLEAALDHRTTDHLGLGHRKQRKQGHPAQQVQVGQHRRHENSSLERPNRSRTGCARGINGFLQSP